MLFVTSQRVKANSQKWIFTTSSFLTDWIIYHFIPLADQLGLKFSFLLERFANSLMAEV